MPTDVDPGEMPETPVLFLRVLFFSDIHSQLEPQPDGEPFEPRGGLEQLMDEVQKLGQAAIEDGGAILLVFAGDFLGVETLYGKYLGGTSILDAIRASAAHFTSMWGSRFRLVTTLGNHEIDRGFPDFQTQFKHSDELPILCHNLDLDKSAYSAGAAVVEVGGRRVGVIGAVTDEIVSHTLRERLATRDAAETVRALLAAMDRSTDLNLAVVHLHDKPHDEVAKVEGIHAVIGGHIHVRRTWHPDDDKRFALCVRSGCYGCGLGILDVRWTDGKAMIEDRWVGVAPTGEPLAEFAPVRSIIKDSRKRISAESAGELEPIGWLRGPLRFATELVRGGPTDLGETLASWLRLALEHRYRAQLEKLGFTSLTGAFLNGGNIRTHFPKQLPANATGDPHDEAAILRAHLRCVLPYSSRPAVYVGPRPSIVQLIGHSIGRLFILDAGGFLQFDGVSYRVSNDGALESVSVLSPGDQVCLGTIDYLCWFDRDRGHDMNPANLGFVAYSLDDDASPVDIVDVMADWAIENSWKTRTPISSVKTTSFVPGAMNPFKPPPAVSPPELAAIRAAWKTSLVSSMRSIRL